MKLHKLWLASAVIAAVAGLFTMLSPPSSANDRRDDHHERGHRQDLVGSWFVTVLVNLPGAPALTLRTLATCNEDGTLVATPQIAIKASSAHGVWRRIGRNEFAITAVYLRRDAAGVEFIGTTKVRATLRLNGATEELTGQFQADLSDAAGNVIESFTGTAHAEEIELEPLE